ncbi:MAG: 6-phosphofructokinase [Clostridia bacterium]|nr:6-phosphofructokinase [Clostridia bacterium]
MGNKSDRVKALGILTSGGDAPGMNAAIRAACRAAIKSGMEVYGIRRGFNGLLDGDAVRLGFKSVSNIINQGGTILKTARCKEFMTDEGVKRAASAAKSMGLDAVLVIGGDGSFQGALKLSREGVKTVCIPATIDNDVGCSEYSIGFDTALNTAVEAVDRLRDTSASHDRTSVVEVMGHTSGQLALSCGMAAGAAAVMIPEKKYDIMRDVVEVLRQAKKSGKSHNIIIVAEGVEGGAARIAEVLRALDDVDLRVTILGHIQRGGVPSALDRIRATQMGVYAVKTLNEQRFDRIIAVRDGRLTDFSIEEGVNMKKELSRDFYETSAEVSL